MTDTEKINLIRDSIPAAQNSIYLNAGSVGPLPAVAYQALQDGNRQELAEGRASMSGYLIGKQTAAGLRRAFAKLVKADPLEIALTNNTTTGMNIAVLGQSWQPGDEIITTDLEHPGGLFPPYIVRQRYDVKIKVIELPTEASPADIVERFKAAITPRTRLLVFSHVAWNTGVCLPMAEIVAMGHRHHVLSVVDAAQAAGAIPLDLPASGVDFYAMSGQKWLCGPEGTGALYVRRDHISSLAQTFAGYRSMGDEGIYDLSGHFMPAPGARRFEVGSVYRPSLKAMLANLAWFDETVGWEWIHNRILHLAAYAGRKLQQLPGVTVITPTGPQAGLVTFNLDGYDPPRVMARLAEENIVLRFIKHPYALRISTGFYNTEGDLDRLVAALQNILAGDPDSLPPSEY